MGDGAGLFLDQVANMKRTFEIYERVSYGPWDIWNNDGTKRALIHMQYLFLSNPIINQWTPLGQVFQRCRRSKSGMRRRSKQLSSEESAKSTTRKSSITRE